MARKVNMDKLVDECYKMQDKVVNYSKRIKEQYKIEDYNEIEDNDTEEIIKAKKLLSSLSCVIGSLEEIIENS